MDELFAKGNDMTGEIRRTKSSGLYGGFAAAFCCLAAWLILGREGAPLLVGVVFMVLYGIVTDRNDRVAYDEYGIVLHTIWGKPILYDWSRVVKVDTAVEQLTDRRFIIGLVLRIFVKETNGKITVHRFPFKYYNGLSEFLAFANCRGKE